MSKYAGSYCPEGSALAQGVKCDVTYWCAGESADKAPCEAAAGLFCPLGSSESGGSVCPSTFYCEGGTADKEICHPGAGFFCGEGSVEETGEQVYPAGFFSSAEMADKAPCSCAPDLPPSLPSFLLPSLPASLPPSRVRLLLTGMVSPPACSACVCRR